jgi:hypothetical protein
MNAGKGRPIGRRCCSSRPLLRCELCRVTSLHVGGEVSEQQHMVSRHTRCSDVDLVADRAPEGSGAEQLEKKSRGQNRGRMETGPAWSFWWWMCSG